MGGHCWSTGEACILRSAYQLHTDTTALVGTFFHQSRGRGGRMGTDYTNTHNTHTRGCKEVGGRVLLPGELRYETVDCKVVRALQSNASITNAIHLTTPSALVLLNSIATDPSHHLTRSTQPSTSWSTRCSCRPSRRPQGRRPSSSASGSKRTRSCSPRAAS